MNGEGPVDLERRVREQEALLEIGLELAATLDLRRVLSLALTKAEEFCKAETSSIWELDEATGELFFRVVRGRAAPEIESLRIPIGQGIVGLAGRPRGLGGGRLRMSFPEMPLKYPVRLPCR